MTFELIDGGRFEINKAIFQTALRWEKYLISHAKRLYVAGDKLAAERAKLIVERCDCLQDGFTVHDIYKRDWKSLKDNETVKQTLDLLSRCNYIREISGDNNFQGGRPTIRYEWPLLVKIHKTSYRGNREIL
ncbi:hypothetical protein [Bartonella sp. ML70XJBT.G]|uniref:hypothetical protein n=1 Tax=Bartonella sp. ML70XJBT.G TaxID=3019093 RepID=UPI0038571C9C